MDVEKQQSPPETVQSASDDAATTDDETLAGGDKQELQTKKEALKLIEKSSEHQNGANGGDTKIKIMEQEKAFSGMTKDELMKYANDPFWVRFRWFMFILFWVVWLAMLIGALMIIVYAPKCAATTKLSWWQTGPIVSVESSAAAEFDLKTLAATGLLYKVPADDTYNAEKMAAHKKAIDDLSAANNAIKVIVDLVPNYVPESNDRFLRARVDKEQRSPFVWVERSTVPNNWLALRGGTAWKQQEDSSYVLSQFAENRYDLQMNNAENKEQLKKVIREYGKLSSVCGFRLANTQHYIVNPALANEEPANRQGFADVDYQFWTHSQTAFVSGLDSLLAEFRAVANNATGDHCSEGTYFGASNSVEFVDLYAGEHGQLSVHSVPVKLNLFQKESEKKTNNNETAAAIVRQLKSLTEQTNKGIYAQLQYDDAVSETSEQYLFTFLLPGGVPALNQKQIAHDAVDQKDPSLKLANLLAMRNSPSFTQGSFAIHQDATKQLVGYTRVKSGSPGYLVLYNPTAATVHGNFNGTGIAADLTVAVVSEGYKEEGITLKHKLFASDIPVSAHSVAILTFVQDSSQ